MHDGIIILDPVTKVYFFGGRLIISELLNIVLLLKRLQVTQEINGSNFKIRRRTAANMHQSFPYSCLTSNEPKNLYFKLYIGKLIIRWKEMMKKSRIPGKGGAFSKMVRFICSVF